jgi:hypothetical protein
MKSWPKSLLLGIAILILGSGPLLAIELAAELGLTSDPNPNPVIEGMICGITLWPALALIAFGLFRLKRWPVQSRWEF